jgi:hypothetical protein
MVIPRALGSPVSQYRLLSARFILRQRLGPRTTVVSRRPTSVKHDRRLGSPGSGLTIPIDSTRSLGNVPRVCAGGVDAIRAVSAVTLVCTAVISLKEQQLPQLGLQW